MTCDVLYIIGKPLKHRCLKLAYIVHLDIWNTSYGQKTGRESNCQFDSQQKKSRIDPIYLAADDVRHTVGKLSTRATTLFQTAPRSKVCSQNYGAPKLWESWLARFWDSHSGVSGDKSHLDVGPVERCRVYYKGEGDGFPQVQAVVSLVCPYCLWLVLAPKVFQLCANHLVWLCVGPCEWVKLVNSS
jgi:hypothetical protein